MSNVLVCLLSAFFSAAAALVQFGGAGGSFGYDDDALCMHYAYWSFH